MKKLIYIVLLILALGVLAACTSTGPDTGAAGSTAEQTTVSDETASMEMEEEMMSEDTESPSEDSMAEEMMEEDAESMESDEHEMADESEAMEEMSETDDMDAQADAMHDEAAEMMDQEDEAMESDHEMAESDEAMEETSETPMEAEEMVEAMALPAWGQITLTNARTGEPFSLADFAGKAVFVEPMATWCSNCRLQQNNVREARAALMDDEAIFIGLSLETNISDEVLAQYADTQGYDWIYAVMNTEILQELANTFGRSITSAPSTPHFIIRPDGSFTDLTTGIESPDQILQQVRAAQG